MEKLEDLKEYSQNLEHLINALQVTKKKVDKKILLKSLLIKLTK